MSAVVLIFDGSRRGGVIRIYVLTPFEDVQKRSR